jgi:hypothetical protein
MPFFTLIIKSIFLFIPDFISKPFICLKYENEGSQKEIKLSVCKKKKRKKEKNILHT